MGGCGCDFLHSLFFNHLRTSTPRAAFAALFFGDHMARLITADNSEWSSDCHYPGPPYVADRMAHVARLTESKPKSAVRAAKSLVRYCEDSEDVDMVAVRESYRILVDAERALAKQQTKST